MDDYNTGNNKLIKKLSLACDGLMWLSEADYPWQVIDWKDESKINSPALLQHYNYHPEIKVTTTTLLSFFESATTEEEWHDELEKAETKRYQNLYSLLIENLSNIQVFLVGEVEIDAYILGKTNNNFIVGLSTKIVET